MPPAPPASSGPSLEGLKITDLAPSKEPAVQLQCAFAVLVWRIPPESQPEIPKVLSMLSSRSLTFSDSAAFESNGLWAAGGTFDQVQAVLSALEQSGAKRLRTKNLLIFQDYPEEIAGIPVESGQTLFYLGAEKMPAGKQVAGGRLSLMLRARPDSPQRGFASVRIEPVFQPAVSLYGGARAPLFEPLTFREGRLLTTMREGDILVLASPKPEPASVFSRFFSDASAQEPGMLLYLIVCQKAGE
jgi:hypothetical protein